MKDLIGVWLSMEKDSSSLNAPQNDMKGNAQNDKRIISFFSENRGKIKRENSHLLLAEIGNNKYNRNIREVIT